MDSSVKTHFSIDYTTDESPVISSATHRKKPSTKKQFMLFVEDYSFTDTVINPEEESLDLGRSQLIIKELLEDTETINKWEANTYDYRFNIMMFIQAGFSYNFNYFFAGPVFILVQICKKWPLLHNLRLPGSQTEKAVLQNIYLLPIVFLCTVYFVEMRILINFIPMIMWNNHLVLVTQSSAVAYTNKKIPSLLRSVKLAVEDFQMVAKVFIYDEEAELRNTINRLQIRAAKLYFSFLEDKNDEYKSLKKRKLTEEENRECQKCIPFGGQIYYSETLNEEDILNTAMRFEKAVFQKKCLLRETRFDQDKLYGYSLACSLLEKTKQAGSQEWKFGLTVLGMAQATIVFSTIDFDKNIIEVLETGWKVFALAVVYFVILLYSIFHIINVLNTSVWNLKQREVLMDEMAKLISYEKRKKSKENNEAPYPNIDIFDDMSLKTWISLRKVFMHYGDRQMETIGLILTLFVGLNLLGLVFLLMESWFDIYHVFNKSLLDMFKMVGYNCCVLVIFICRIMLSGASLNRQYRQHRELITKNRSLVISLFRSYPKYIGEKPLKPESFFEVEGLRLLKEEFGEDYSKEKLKERLAVLTETYDDILKELTFEETHYPFKIMKVPITFALIKTLLTSIFSGSVAFLIKYISNKSH